MDFFNKIIECSSDIEADKLVKEEIERLNNESNKIEQLGFIDGINSVSSYKGFIPLDTRIKYANRNVETYSMNCDDYLYEFTHFIRSKNITNKGGIIHSLETFINSYFGTSIKNSRESIFNDIAWNSTETDEDYFNALENNKLSDLKGKNAALCTERSALAQQVLSLYGIESYYCMGCVKIDNQEEAHCFNIVNRKNDYALLDYSVPVSVYNDNNKLVRYYPFVGELSNVDFINFIDNGNISSFDNYRYIGKTKERKDKKREYVVGKYSIINNIDNNKEGNYEKR